MQAHEVEIIENEINSCNTYIYHRWRIGFYLISFYSVIYFGLFGFAAFLNQKFTVKSYALSEILLGIFACFMTFAVFVIGLVILWQINRFVFGVIKRKRQEVAFRELLAKEFPWYGDICILRKSLNSAYWGINYGLPYAASLVNFSVLCVFYFFLQFFWAAETSFIATICILEISFFVLPSVCAKFEEEVLIACIISNNFKEDHVRQALESKNLKESRLTNFRNGIGFSYLVAIILLAFIAYSFYSFKVNKSLSFEIEIGLTLLLIILGILRFLFTLRSHPQSSNDFTGILDSLNLKVTP